MGEGRFVGRNHEFFVTVYFEDTDFSGVVYHASYLRFMERARSDMLKCAGIGQREAFESGSGVYAVSKLSIKHIQSAKFDDQLRIVSSVESLGGATCVIHQRVMLNDIMIADAVVTAAFLSRDGRPRRQPRDWVEIFKNLLPEGL